MWTIAAQSKWVDDNTDRYQIEVIYVNNGYAVRYRKLRQM